ncbi:MAG: hypothetical protein FD180_3382 [Planctomycetota bacterium]|nr:MAG: hypothetical protein FD180_3382 [Planctomycetota bacterium]
MWRLIGFIAAFSMFLFAGLAEAQEPQVLTMKAELKSDFSAGKELSFVYINGDSLYPDGTRIFVGLQPPDSFKFLLTTSCIVEKGHFLAEIGPLEQHFPPGRYRVVGAFRFEEQNPAMQARLGDFRDLAKCVKDDTEFAADYERVNPVRFKLLKDYIDRTGRCPGKTGLGETHLVIGTDEDADRARETEKAFLHGYADAAAHLTATLATVGASPDSDPALVLAPWRVEWTDHDATLRRKCASVIYLSHPEAAAAIQAAFMNLESLSRHVESLTAGRGAELCRDIKGLAAKGDAIDKDESRRLNRLMAELAALETARDSQARAVAASLAHALYGSTGLEPAPARARVYVRELLEPFGVEPQTK